MSYWNKLLTKDNFILAWKRINTGTNIYYKRFFREVYIAYEISYQSNLENLMKRIKGGSYKPCEPDRIFMPKPSGLQRPITLLTVEDQIVWQAIANFLMDKFYEKRKEVERINVYSNLHSNDKKYFFKNWKISYSDYIKKIHSIFEKNKWIVHFDLAAFFDTISHDHIINLINPRNKESEIAKFVEKILKCWTSEKRVGSISHGVPQGPIASNFIGELIFLEIDLKMKEYIEEFSYLRYVDDIRLLAKDEYLARKGMIILEQLCRNKGLVPQSKKTTIIYAKSEEEAIGKDFSFIPSENDSFLSKEFIDKIINFDKNEIIDVSKFKYYLFNSLPDTKLLDKFIILFSKYPDLSDAFCAYFKQLRENKKLIDFLISQLKLNRTPYDYVEGNLWLLLSEIDYNRKSSNLLMNTSKMKILNTRSGLYLRYGLLVYIAPLIYKFNKSDNFKILCKYIYEKSPIILGILLSSISVYFDRNDFIKVIRQSFRRTKLESGLIAATRLAIDNIKFKGLKVSRGIKSPIRNTLVGLGLTTSQIIPEITPFQEIMKDRYKIDITDWKKYLRKEYSHAHKIIVIAESAYYMNPSSWICNMDSFNNIVTISIINLDSSVKQKIVRNNGKLVDYGVLIAKGGPLDRKYTFITDILREVHMRRCLIPEAHPFNIKTKKRSKYLKTGERNYYYGKLKKAYYEIDRIFQNFL